MSTATRTTAASGTVTTNAATLQVRGLEVGYGSAPILREVDLAVHPGEVLGLIGPNGAGKSTLLRTMLGRLTPTRGHVRLEGEDVTRLRARERARRLAHLPQETGLDLAVPCREIVAMGRYAHRRRLGAHPRDRAVVDAAMERVGVAHLAERHIGTLSGGQRQLVLLAKLLAQESRTLLLDEPVSALDLGYQIEVLAMLRALADEGRALVVVLHDLDLAARHCDRLALVAGGGLRALGRPHAVLTAPLLREVYRVDAVVEDDPHTGTPRVTALRRADEPAPAPILAARPAHQGARPDTPHHGKDRP